MRIVEVKTKEQQKSFIEFRKKIYKANPIYVDNNLFMLKELFAENTSFVNDKEIYVINVEDNEKVVCQGLIIYAKKLPEYVQLSFFESEQNQREAVELLVDKAMEIGKKHNCKKLVVGLNGHVNYGLGFLNSHYDEKNSFSGSVNPEYYNEYFKGMGCEEINLNTYRIAPLENRLSRYSSILKKINEKYVFKCFNKREFDYYSKIYTDLNNKCFVNHRYYYERSYEEDKEMLKELFLFMKEESLIFIFDGEKPIGFIMWYPDFNELVKPGEAFGAKHFIKNLFMNKRIKTAKVMEFGILEEYRKMALPIGLLHQSILMARKRGINKAVTSWILEENGDSNSVCRAICDELYIRYVAYEKEIN